MAPRQGVSCYILAHPRLAYLLKVHQQLLIALAVEDFQDLKAQFICAPVLQVPDPKRQFVVEVVPFNTGVGAILCQ